MEFLVRNFDSTHADPETDRSGCRKRGMIDAEMQDGHAWGNLETLPRFVVVKCPEIARLSEVPTGSMRTPWKDDFDYDITATRPAQGEFDVRVYEKNPGTSNGNIITGAKATKISSFLTAWGCTDVSVGSNEITFTFSLWNAVRSSEFWGVSVAAMSFSLVSYVSGTGVGTVRVTLPEAITAKQAQYRIEERGGTVTIDAYPDLTFTIERSAVLTKFRADIKDKAERVCMFQRHRFAQSIMDQAETNGGSVTLTKAELLSGLVDKMAE